MDKKIVLKNILFGVLSFHLIVVKAQFPGRTKNLFGQPLIITGCILNEFQVADADDPRNNAVTVCRYSGGLLRSSVTVQSSGGAISSDTFIYNTGNFITQMRNTDKNKISGVNFFYDSAGRVNKMTTFNEPLALTVTFSYEGDKKVIVRHYTPAGGLYSVTTHNFDNNYNLVSLKIEKIVDGNLKLYAEASFTYDLNIKNPYLPMGDCRFIAMAMNTEEAVVESSVTLLSANACIKSACHYIEENNTEETLFSFVPSGGQGFPATWCLPYKTNACNVKYSFQYTCN